MRDLCTINVTDSDELRYWSEKHWKLWASRQKSRRFETELFILADDSLIMAKQYIVAVDPIHQLSFKASTCCATCSITEERPFFGLAPIKPFVSHYV